MKTLLQFVCIIFISQFGRGSHIVGGHVDVDCLGNSQYQITTVLIRDCSGISVPTFLNMNITSSCTTFTVQANMISVSYESNYCPSAVPNDYCNGGPNPGYEQYTYTTTITLPPCSDWHIYYTGCCGASSDNITNNTNNSYYYYSDLNNSYGNCENQVGPSKFSVPMACVNDTICFDPLFSPTQNDSVLFYFENVWIGQGMPVTYSNGNSAGMPVQGIEIDSTTGSFCVIPPSTGTYNINIASVEYLDGMIVHTNNYTFILSVQNCTGSNNAPVSSGILNPTGNISLDGNIINVCPGANLCFDVVFTDSDLSDVLSVQSNILDVFPGANVNISGTNPITANICISNISESSFIYLIASDGVCPIMGTASQGIEINTVFETFDFNDTQLCFNDTVSYETPLTANWTVLNGDMASINCSNCSYQVLYPDTTTTYYIEMLNSCGVIINDTLTISVYLDTYNLNDTIAGQCGDYYLLANTNDIEWIYQGGVLSGDSLYTSILNPGWNTIYTSHGIANCLSYDTVEVFVDNGVLSLSLSDTLMCDTGHIMALASGIFPTTNSYDWNGLGQSITNNSNNQNFFVDQSGWIYVTTYNNHCQSIDSVYVWFDTLSIITGNIIGNTGVQALATESYSYDLGQGLIYTWNVLGGNLLSGQGTNSISIEWGAGPNGSISIQYSSAGSCFYNDSISVQVSPVNGIDTETIKSIEIYPNPATDNLSLNYLEGIQTLQIITSEGKSVAELNTNGLVLIQLNVSEFGNGLYHIIDEKGKLRGRFLVQH